MKCVHWCSRCFLSHLWYKKTKQKNQSLSSRNVRVFERTRKRRRRGMNILLCVCGVGGIWTPGCQGNTGRLLCIKQREFPLKLCVCLCECVRMHVWSCDCTCSQEVSCLVVSLYAWLSGACTGPVNPEHRWKMSRCWTLASGWRLKNLSKSQLGCLSLTLMPRTLSYSVQQ